MTLIRSWKYIKTIFYLQSQFSFFFLNIKIGVWFFLCRTLFQDCFSFKHYYTIPYCTQLYFTILHWTSTLWQTIKPYKNVLYLYKTTLHYTLLYCTKLYLYNTILYCSKHPVTKLYGIALYYAVQLGIVQYYKTLYYTVR